MKAVYCHWDGNPRAMVPVLRRLVLDTSDGDPAAAAHYLFAYSGFGYWSSLTGSGDAYSACMRTENAQGPVHKWTGERWPEDVDVYHDNPGSRAAVLEYRDGRYLDSALLSWPQRWLYLIYPQVLAVVRYVAPDEHLGNRLPLGIGYQPLPWAETPRAAHLRQLEQQADRRVDQLRMTTSLNRAAAAPPPRATHPTRG